MNRIVLMGRLTKDPELKTTNSNLKIGNFTMAVNRRFAKRDDKEKADFVNIVAFEKLAEFTTSYFKKGMQVIVSGRLQIRSWENDEGKKSYFTEVVIDEASFADSKKDVQDTTAQTYEKVQSEVDDDDLPF